MMKHSLVGVHVHDKIVHLVLDDGDFSDFETQSDTTKTFAFEL